MTNPNNLLQRAIDYVRDGKGLEDEITTIAGLNLPRGEPNAEHIKQVEHIVDLLTNYHADKEAKRPLSIVVFGPPGSGKSTFVTNITEAVPGYAPVKTANLTQIGGTAELAKIFAAGKRSQTAHDTPLSSTEDNLTPVYFFDEFDAALHGAPLGWLSWFLAPMQDGVVLVEGEVETVCKAVFMFAGGTAETLEEFNERARLDAETYRARKVPDFVSRLRGAIDIGGVNAPGDARIVPRALALRRHLSKQSKLPEKRRPIPPSIEKIGQLLLNGHFVHGIRSMETLLDAGWTTADKPALPEAIRRQHFSRGDLDGQLIGISAGLNEVGSEVMFKALTEQLLRSGANLAYAGASSPDGTLEKLRKAASEAPPALDARDNQHRVRHYLGRPASLARGNDVDSTSAESVDFVAVETIGAPELEELGAPADSWFEATVGSGAAYDPRRHLAWALSLFRLRVGMLQDVSALVVLGGKDDGLSWGRIAGIAEEVMIALAMHKPVYVLGGAGGAAKAVGQLLGLDKSPVGFERCLKPAPYAAFTQALSRHAQSFEIPGEPDSPRDLAELRRFLFHRGVTTAAWPWNGLTQAENRTLFDCAILKGGEAVEQAVGLIVQGLSRIDWKPAGGGRKTPLSVGVAR